MHALRSLAPISFTRLDLTDELDLAYAYTSELLAELEILLDVPGTSRQGQESGWTRPPGLWLSTLGT